MDKSTCDVMLGQKILGHIHVLLVFSGALEEVIMGDVGSSVDVWTHVVSLCSELERDDLSRAILSVLLSQSGTRIVTPDPEGARLMEHVYL